MSNIAVVGLGIIGSVWARHYRDAGVLAGVWNRTHKGEWKDQFVPLEELGNKADAIQIVVSDPDAVKGVIEKLVPQLKAGKTVIQSSTIDPESSDGFRSAVRATGAEYLEAPFTGSKPAAEQKKTVFYLGGEEALIHRMESYLKHVSETRFHIGDHRQATTLKLAMNLNIAAQIQGLCEALTLARGAKISDQVFFDVLSKNVSHSGVAALKAPKLISNDFSPQFSIKHLLKDLRLATRVAGCDEYPILDTMRDQLHIADQKGYGDEDFSALIKVLRDLQNE